MFRPATMATLAVLVAVASAAEADVCASTLTRAPMAEKEVCAAGTDHSLLLKKVTYSKRLGSEAERPAATDEAVPSPRSQLLEEAASENRARTAQKERPEAVAGRLAPMDSVATAAAVDRTAAALRHDVASLIHSRTHHGVRSSALEGGRDHYSYTRTTPRLAEAVAAEKRRAEALLAEALAVERTTQPLAGALAPELPAAALAAGPPAGLPAVPTLVSIPPVAVTLQGPPPAPPAVDDAGLPAIPTFVSEKEKAEAASRAGKHLDVVLSPTTNCIAVVTILYSVVWAWLYCVTVAGAYAQKEYELQATLSATAQAISFAPMVCVLFLATQLRAIYLMGGSLENSEKFGIPSKRCVDGHLVCTVCIVVVAVVKISDTCVGSLALLGAITEFILYGALCVVGHGLWTMDAPPELGPKTPMSDTTKVISTLVIYFFIVHILLNVSKVVDGLKRKGPRALVTVDSSDNLQTYNLKRSTRLGTRFANAPDSPRQGYSRQTTGLAWELQGAGGGKIGGFTKAMQAAIKALDLAPMLCVLFLAARMRSLQMGQMSPQPWALVFFYVSSYGLILYSFVSAIHTRFESGLFAVVEAIFMVILYIAVILVMVSVYTIHHVTGPTPHVSRHVFIIMSLVTMFLLIDAAHFIFGELERLKYTQSAFMTEMLSDSKEALAYCPMFCVLMVSVRMQAALFLRTSQSWSKNCTLLAALSLVLDVFLLKFCHIFMTPAGNNWTRVLRTILNGVMHASAMAVIVSLWILKPSKMLQEEDPGWDVPDW